MHKDLKLPPEALRLSVDLSGFDLPEAPKAPTPILGQPRAQAALEFGVAMPNPGYNIFVMGEPGTGRLSLITSQLSEAAQKSPAPPAFAYADNFSNPREPVAVCLPAGYGHEFGKDIDKLIDDLLATFPAVFESPAYQQKKSALERQFSQHYNAAIDLVDERARAMNIALFRESESVTFAPLRDGKTLDEDQFALLSQAEREQFHKQVEALEEYLGDVLIELPQWRRELVEKLRQLDCDTIKQAIDPLFAALQEKYQHIEDAVSF
ncbi:MAG: ATP-dependent protease, partial [Methylomonas sp.]